MENMWMFFSIRGVLIAILLMLGFVYALAKPKIGLGIIIALSILRAGFFSAYFPPIYDLHMPQVFIILTLISWLIHSNKYPLRLNLDIVLMFLFFAVICYSRYHFGTPVFEHKIPNEFFREVVIFFLAIQFLRKEKDVKDMLWLIVLLHLFLALRAYYFYKTDYMPIALPNYVFVNRNAFANSLALVFPIAYILSRTTKSKLLKILGMFSSVWCVIGIILTYSRAGFIALMVGVLGLLFFEKKKWRIVGVVLFLLLLILPRLSEKYINRIKSIEAYQEDSAAMARVAANHAALNMFRENPIFGIGAGNFNYLVVDFTPPEYRQWVAEDLSIHNVIMQATSETGIVGALVFLLLVFRGLKNTFVRKDTRNKQNELNDLAIMLRISLFAVFIALQFGQGAYFGNLYLILPFASAIKMISKKKD